MVYVYDVEIFPNFFSIVLWDVNNKENKLTYYIYKDHNDIDYIYDLFNENHWFVGYNSTSYDDLIMEFILSSYYRYSKISSDQITKELFEYSSELINSDYNRYTKGMFNSFDLMRVGNIRKSLKLVGIDLKHPKVQDLPKPFDEPVKASEVDLVLDYNHNDVEITYKLYHELRDEIKLRQNLTKKYGQNLMNYPDSGIANQILAKDYENFSGTPYKYFKNSKTHRDDIELESIISDKIEFQTDHLKSFLRKIKNTSVNKDTNMEFSILINKTPYDIKKGGLHSCAEPEVFTSCDQFSLKDADVTSYYPMFMINNRCKPEHLHDCFISLLKSYVDTRVKAKKKGDKVTSDGLKIVVNSIFGKMGFEYHWLYDIKAMYQVTINCQLFLLMLIEKLEMNGIQVFYANTDGITAKVHKDKEELYYKICKQWEEQTDFELEFEEYKKCIIRDVNNYLWVPQDQDEDIKYKGFFDIHRYKDVTKAYDKPIIPYSIYKFFTEDIPVEVTIMDHEDILDFCMAQKASDRFDIFFDYIEMGQLVSQQQQKTNRYYVGKKGGNLYKESDKSKISLVAGEPVHILNDVDNTNAKDYPIKYSYYIKEASKTIGIFRDRQTDLFL